MILDLIPYNYLYKVDENIKYDVNVLISSLLIICICLLLNVQGNFIYLFSFKMPNISILNLYYNIRLPTTGIVRSLINFYHLDFHRSFSFHILGILLGTIILLQVPVRVINIFYKKNIYDKKYDKKINYLMIIFFFIIWIKNLFLGGNFYVLF